ncbi:MAG: glucose-6-phosphate dehydrogenase [Gemmatimonadota bacterium]|nr:glucose-6-phosphate dehydrogenase [Gemmatimonadota bacterium]
MTQRDKADRCTAVIFGGAGDLARKKLISAIYYLAEQKLLPDGFAMLAVARETGNDASYRALMREAMAVSDEIRNVDDSVWQWLCERTHYTCGEFSDDATYTAVAKRLAEIEGTTENAEKNRLFYLAIPPSVFEMTLKHLTASGLAKRTDSYETRPWTRIVIEKPFGRSLESARDLNRLVLGSFGEHQVYRIDHYLGKETVQNILVFRFANTLFEPLWSNRWISHVQITAAESVGIETRGRYYEEAGIVRDMFQNHLLQLLTLATLEPPSAITADAVRDEKVKVLRAVRPLLEGGDENIVRAQYADGMVNGQPAIAYRAESNVAPGSTTATFAAMRLFIDNWRWKGVPFFLRSGKRLAKRTSEIAVQFKAPPLLLFGQKTQEEMAPSLLVLRVQPDEGISLRLHVKTPGAVHELTPGLEITPVDMNFSYTDSFGGEAHPAYETLLLDCMIGDPTLFTRSDEVEMAWSLIDPILQRWENNPVSEIPTYPAGSWGPSGAEALIAKDDATWR